jgi:hypothetical protein
MLTCPADKGKRSEEGGKRSGKGKGRGRGMKI